MSAVEWATFPEPWQSIGREWCEQLFAIVNDGKPRPPTLHSGAWSGSAFRERLKFHGISLRAASARLHVEANTVSRWGRGEFIPTQGHRLAIDAMFEDAARG
jgi:hypothetical protein